MKETKRIMSLQDGTKKMSKSDASALARINLNDNADEIHKKIKKSKTDSKNLIEYDENRPEIFNLLNIFSAVTNIQPTILATQYENKGFGKFKEDLANAIIDKISPISIKINKLINDDKAFLQKILEDGRLHASYIASKTQDEVFKIIGLK
jgi:tryptophanyl-tRNA synthetase